MNEKLSAPMAVTNGEIRENGEMKNSGSGDTCGVGDSLILCSKSNNDNVKSRDSVSDIESNVEIPSGISSDDIVLKVCDSVSNPDNLPANMISKQVDPCEPDSKGSDSLVEDSADTLIENEVEDDFKLALSPEASVADSLSEQNQEDSTVQTINSSSNILEEMEVDEHKEEPKLSEEIDGPDLGKESPDIAQLSDVNMGSNINNCAIGEGVACGDSEMIVDKDCASDACVRNTLNSDNGSDVPSLLKGEAEPSEVTPRSPSPVLVKEAMEDADPSSNMENCQESLTSAHTQDETELAVQSSNTQVSSTSSTAQDDVDAAVLSSNAKGCPEISNTLVSSDEKSTNSERDSGPILDDFKKNAEPVLDDVKNNAEPVLDDVKNNAEPVLEDIKNNVEPVVDNNVNNAEAVLDDVENIAEPVVDNVKNNAGPVVDDFNSNAKPSLGNDVNDAKSDLDECKKNADNVLDEPVIHAEPDVVKKTLEPVLEDLEKISEPVLGEVNVNAKLVLDDHCENDVEMSEESVNEETRKLEGTSNAEVGPEEQKSDVKISGEDSTTVEKVGDGTVLESDEVSESNLDRVALPNMKTSDDKIDEEITSPIDKIINEVCDEITASKIDEEITSPIDKIIDEGDKGSAGKIDEEITSPIDKIINEVGDKGSAGKIDEEITSPIDKILDCDDKGTASPSGKIEDDSHSKRTTSPTNQNNEDERSTPVNDIRDGSAELSEAEKEDALLVSPIKNSSVSNETRSCKSPIGIDDEDLLKSPERKKNDEQIVDMEEEEALLNSPDPEVTENKLLEDEDLLSSPDEKGTDNKLREEETGTLEDEDLLNSPEPKIVNAKEADIEMKEDDLLKSPESKTIAEIAENTSSEEKMEDDSTPVSPNSDIAPISGSEVAVSEDTSKIDPESNVDAALNIDEEVPVDDSAKTTSPASQETQPLSESDSSVEAAISTEVVESVEVEEPMEVEEEPCEERVPSKEEGVGMDNKEEKSKLKLALNGTSDCSYSSDVKSTIFSNSSRKDKEGSASMTLSRKRAHSPVADSRELDEKSKFARTVNGLDEVSTDADASPKKEEDVSTEKKKYELTFDINDGTVSKVLKSDGKVLKSDDTKDKKDVPEVTLDFEADMKTKDEIEESLLDPVDLSYLRKLHKGTVEKLSRNDLEELLVQKLCEAITERSEVGEMRLRCQALERGQEKWKEKYSQLQKQVRELNIVIKKFLSEQASSSKDKSTPPTPVRITRSVGLQVALPGSGQRTLAGMRIRAQRDAAAAAASSAVSAAVVTSSAVASSAAASSAAVSPAATSNINKPANTNSPSINTAQNCVPVRTVAMAQSPARRIQETPSKISSPTIQQLPQRQVNSSVSSSTTIPAVISTPPRVSSAPQPSLTLTRPQLSSQVQPQVQTTQISGNIRARSNSTVAMRGHQQTHVVQVQQRQQSIQQASHTTGPGPQVVMSPNASPQISRLQVVLAPQQQQQLLQQQPIVLRQPQPANKDVEIIDLDKDDRSRQPTRNTVQQISQVTATPTFPPNGNMTVRLVSNQQSGTPMTSQSHMTLLVPATAQQQKMIITSAPSTVQLNSNQGKSRTNSNVVLKGVVQAMQSQGNAVRQQGVVQQGTIIPSRGITILQQPQQAQQQMPQLQQLRPLRMGHPAPLPAAPSVQPDNPVWKMPPPKPSLKIQHTDNGIVLSWNMNLYSSHEDIDTYQLYAYQEGNSPPSSSLWKKVGDVKALPLPMACTLTQFAEGHRYHFAVRAVDVRARIGPFSAPGNIRLEQKAQ